MHPGNNNPWHSSLVNQSQTGASQQAGPTPDRQMIQSGSRDGYADFPWTDEPQNMSMPATSTPGLTPPLSRTLETDKKSTRENRLQKASTSTLTDAGRQAVSPKPGLGGETIARRSAYASSPSAPEPQIPMSTPVAQRRPPVIRRVSEYTAMLLALDDMPMVHGTLIKAFVFILLAGFLVLPATFVNLQDKQSETKGVAGSLIGSLQHLPEFIVGCVCGGIGLLGMCWFWYRWQGNYIWICNNIFMPGAISGVHGVIATVASNYGQNGKLVFVGTSKWTLIATAGVTVVCGGFLLFYKFVVLRNAKKKHDREYGERKAGRRGEGTGFETHMSSTA